MTENEAKALEEIRVLMEKHPLSYFAMVFSIKRSTLKDFVLKHSAFLDGKVDSKNKKPYTKSTRIMYAVNGLNDYPKCKTCGKPIMRNIAVHEDVNKLFCCNRCAQKDSSVIAKTKATKLKNHGDQNYNNMAKSRQTCKERYGVECSWQSEHVKQASKETLLKHYGVDHQMHSKEVVDGMRRRYKDKHGVEHAFQDPAVKAKINAKNQENYGVDWPM